MVDAEFWPAMVVSLTLTDPVKSIPEIEVFSPDIAVFAT